MAQPEIGLALASCLFRMRSGKGRGSLIPIVGLLGNLVWTNLEVALRHARMLAPRESALGSIERGDSQPRKLSQQLEDGLGRASWTKCADR